MPSQKFSEELITKGQEYFEKRCGIKASEEKMVLWLDSLADFYGFFEEHAVRQPSREEIQKELATN